MACPSDDDTPPIAQDSIIGTWKLLESFENGAQESLEPCELESTLVFLANGDFSSQFYEEGVQTGDCELDETATGTWANAGNLYSITIDGDTETEIVTFQGNTFYTEETEIDGGETFVYKDVFIKQ